MPRRSAFGGRARPPPTVPFGCKGGYIDPHRSGLAIEPLDMRAGTDTALARVVKVFGSVRPHHAYLFASKRAPRIKALFHDCVGIWLVAALSSTATFIWSG
ncbi:IS66 family insertion sequence element accessory protein TnpB [Ralstonia pseudosolanacearum]|uniref:IS66 family insertion sequence element accessory protein TnpB n=1 Tax=Ralstonia pseudosolanacearum TaxID=1310165 RepID=UPI00399D647B